MIGVLNQFERGARTELSNERFQELQVGELITRSLHEQHWNLHCEEVRSALVRRSSRRVQRKSEEHHAVDPGQRRCGLRLRSHAAAEGLAACE